MKPGHGMRHPLFRSATLPIVVTAGLLLLVLGIMLVASLRSLDRLTPLQSHQAVMQRVHSQILFMQYAELYGLNGALNRELIGSLERNVAQLADEPELLSRRSRDFLDRAINTLKADKLPPNEALAGSITLLHEALAEENRAHGVLLGDVQAQARLEMWLALAAAIVIPLAGVLTLFLLRQRFLLPLANLNTLLLRLADGDFVPARMEVVDPVLAPLIANYNHMVERLAELEAEQTAHRRSLEAEVRAASGDLLALSRGLAQAEKLAAVGEMAASLAHELRNPLAGIQLALTNLHNELPPGEAQQRLALVANETRRVTAQLNGLLDQARQIPEKPVPVPLARTITELLNLMRYQTPPDIIFEQDVPQELTCRLPETRLRQALLNLLLNAAQAMPGGGTVQVSAQMSENGTLNLAVCDTGPGLPQSILQSGIRHFASQREGGTGLGLASVRRLVLDMGGELKLENMDGQGARITLVLPCPPSNE